MSSTNDKDTYIWSDEETRVYLQLRIEEKDKGNARNSSINDAGKKAILDKFQEVYGKTQSWGKFRNKYNTCSKQYLAFQRLTRNKTGLGYDSKGALEMSDDWWKEREKEWPGVGKKFKGKMANMDLMIKLFEPVRVTGAEGWSAQQGEEFLDSMIPEECVNESDAASESRQVVPPLTQAADAPSSSSKPKQANKKRRAAYEVANVIRNSSESRDEILAQKNRLLEQHPDFSSSQSRAMCVLHSLSSVRMWSPLYKAAILHLQACVTNRQTFLAYEEDENKVLYLEFATGQQRDD